MRPLIRYGFRGDVVYVSFDDGRSWWALHPDGTTHMQFRPPPVPQVYSAWAPEE